MRVIAGKCRRYKLFTPRGEKIRPTSDIIKETLFNMLGDRLYNCVFADLFAGTGQIGIEAISRGAQKSVFIDFDRESIGLIKKNLEHTGLTDEAIVIQGPLPRAVSSLQRHSPDVIFMDPPYNKGLYRDLFVALKELECVQVGALIIAESSLSEDFSFLEEEGFSLEREKTYKSSKHVFAQLLKR